MIALWHSLAVFNLPPMREWWLQPQMNSLRWVLLTVMLVLLGIQVFLWLRRDLAVRRDTAAVRERCQALGLSGEETRLLLHMVTVAGLKNRMAVLSDRGVFEYCLAEQLRDSSERGMSPRLQRNLAAMLGSIREKLGLRHVPQAGASAVHSSRQLTPDSRLSVTASGPEPVEGTLEESGPADFVVELDRAIPGRPGDRWMVRHSSGMAVWEFEAVVIDNDGRRARLGHSEEVRLVNRRRFRRVPVDRNALVAKFGFVSEGSDGPPRFVPAKLVEIAGPGLLLTTTAPAAPDDRVLVVVELHPTAPIQALALVRRVQTESRGVHRVAVELVGLNSDEIADLVGETTRLGNAEPDADEPAAAVAAGGRA